MISVTITGQAQVSTDPRDNTIFSRDTSLNTPCYLNHIAFLQSGIPSTTSGLVILTRHFPNLCIHWLFFDQSQG